MPLLPDGARVVRLRETAGLSQDDLADEAGVSKGTIERLELGKGCYPRTLKLVADALGVSADELRRDRAAASPAPSTGTTSTPRRGPAWRLPRPRSRFIGREQQRDALSSELEQHRLVTLKGAGGVGKTRLAIELAHRVATRWPVAFVELADWHETEPLLERVAEALGSSARSQPPIERIAGCLSDEACLLVLDNCEHLAAACADLIPRVLAALPELRIVATSRGRLKVEGERVQAVEPLAAPSEAASVEEVEGSDAGQLLVDRVQQLRSGYRLRDEDAAAVAAICRRLDGLPLALELAAARTELLSLRQVARQLDDSAEVLDWASGVEHPRHRTMQLAIAWSHDQLDDKARLLHERLAVFVGSWTLELAQEACGFEPLDARDVAVGLLELTDRSLITVDHRGDETTCRLLEPIRQHAIRLLRESDEEDALRRRHFLALLGCVERLAPSLFGPEGARVGACLDRMRSDLDAALDWSSQADDCSSEALRLATALNPWRLVRGQAAQGRARLEVALARADASVAEDLRGRALDALGASLGADRRWDEALAACEEAHGRLLASGDELGALRALSRVGAALHGLGRLSEAAEVLARCEEATRSRGGRLYYSILANLMVTLSRLQRVDEARVLGRRARALAIEGGDEIQQGMIVVQLAELELGAGNDSLAGELFEEARELTSRAEARAFEVSALAGLTFLALRRNELGEARTRIEEAFVLVRGHGLSSSLPGALLGFVEIREGRLDVAEARLLEAARSGVAERGVVGSLRSVAGLAWLALERGDPVRAAELWGWFREVVRHRGTRDGNELDLVVWEELAGLPSRLDVLDEPEREAALERGRLQGEKGGLELVLGAVSRRAATD
ncbi:MAG: helix-turn-helix domain-containing protein [Acidobacteriota bacterium]